MMFVLILFYLFSTYCNGQEEFIDEFLTYNSSLWIQDTGIYHCDDVCFIGKASHLKYNHNDISNTSSAKGLLVDCNNDPCSTNHSACCIGTECANYASGHLTSVNYYKYGHFEWYGMKSGHGDTDNPTGPHNEFSCIGCYVGQPEHNEITMCLNHTSNQIHAGYWYNQNENGKIITLDNYHLSTTYHNYHYFWNETEINFMLDSKSLWRITVSESKLPTEACQIKIILRPHDNPTYQGASYLFMDKFGWKPA